MIRRRLCAAPIAAVIALFAFAACSDDDGAAPATSAPSTATATATPSPTAVMTATAAPSTPTASPVTATSIEPRGFPIDANTRLGLVVGTRGQRSIAWGQGPTVEAYTRNDQPSPDAERANRAGWNCRVHVEYEAQPAVDWYIPVGTPIVATMNGTASLYVISVSNPFDVYRVAREPYLGNPDRGRAPVSPFPGPGGGKGVFVRVENGAFATEYAHLEIDGTIDVVPFAAFVAPYGPRTDYGTMFRALRDFRAETLIARWTVRRGDVVGVSGDSGYSEGPHLHYTVRRAGGPLLCPTGEAGFADGGWLLR